jgi:hypothetical protein
MVLHVLGLIASIAVGPVHQEGFNEAVAKETAMLLLRKAAVVQGVVDLPIAITGMPPTVRRPDRSKLVFIDFMDGAVAFSTIDGSVTGLYLLVEKPTVDILTKAQCLERAGAFLRDLGWSGEVRVLYTERRRQEWHFEVVPEQSRVPFSSNYSWRVAVETGKGRITFLRTARTPVVHGSPFAAISEQQGRDSAVMALARYRPMPMVVQGGSVALQVPGFLNLPNELSEDHIAIARAGRAIPIYSAAIANADSQDPRTGEYREFYHVYVDARTGQALAILPIGELMFGGGSPRSEFSWARSVKGLRVAGRAFAADSVTPAVQKGPKALPSRVLVTTDRGVTCFGFDPATGMIACESDGIQRFAAPSPALRKALAKVAFKAKPFGTPTVPTRNQVGSARG